MFDLSDFGGYMLIAALSYLLPRPDISRLGRARRPMMVDSAGQDQQPQGGVDEKPANPDQKSFTGL